MMLRRTVRVSVLCDLRTGFGGGAASFYLLPYWGDDTELLRQVYSQYPRDQYKIRVRVFDAR